MRKLCFIIFLLLIATNSWGHMLIATSGVAPPTLSTATVATNGTTLTLQFSKDVFQGSGYNDTDWDVDCPAVENNIAATYVSGNGTNSHVYTLGSTVYSAVTCNIDFNGDLNSIEDGNGVDLAQIIDGNVNNTSNQLPPESEEACTSPCVFVSSWTGNDVQNAGTSNPWDSVTGGFVSHGTTAGAGFSGNESKYLVLSGTISGDSYVSEAISLTAQYGERYGIYIATGFVASDFILLNPVLYSGQSHTNLRYNYDGANHSFVVTMRTSLDGTVNIGSPVNIQTGKWYQVRIKWQQNTQGDDAGAGCSWELHDETSGLLYTGNLAAGVYTANQPATVVRVGHMRAPWKSLNIRTDVLRLQNTFAFPDLRAW